MRDRGGAVLLRDPPHPAHHAPRTHLQDKQGLPGVLPDLPLPLPLPQVLLPPTPNLLAVPFYLPSAASLTHLCR